VSIYLLDVNVLVALFDEAHIHHIAAHSWFDRHPHLAWRSCPITENGLLRILSHPGYPNAPTPLADLALRLEEFKKASVNYEFWSDDVSLSQSVVEKPCVIGSAQSTDAYLLLLCSRKQGALATFDHRIRPSLIGESSDTLIEYVSV
jgi:uncharacterized protein